MADATFNRTQLPATGGEARYQTRDYDVRTEEGAREALARVASRGTQIEKTAVRAAVAKYWPNIGKGGKPEDLFPNSNMNP